MSDSPEVGDPDAPSEGASVPPPISATGSVIENSPPSNRPGRATQPGRVVWLIALVLLAAATGAGWLLGRRTRPAPASTLAGQIAAAARLVAPAVVKIQVQSPGISVRGSFRLPPGVTPPSIAPRAEHSLGSGVIIDAGGDIVTNRHVVNRAESIEVTLPGDPRTYYARLLGSDADTDLAVIHVSAGRALAWAHFGDSSKLAVGNWVVAIGNPFGLTGTVTAGIVSALNRPAGSDHQFQTFIQTDAPINPGNSGGPLINLEGQVVGINTAIESTGDGYQGIGFALPSNLVESIESKLLHQGRVVRGSIGVYYEGDLDPAVRRVYGLPEGVPLSDVVPNGPAARAGLKAGDVITALDGSPIANGVALARAVAAVPVGAALRVVYQRGGATRTTTVAVVDRTRLFPATTPAPAPARPALPPDLGMTLVRSPLGLRITGVIPDSFADSIGVEADDILIEVNRQPIHSLADLHHWIAAARPGRDIALAVLRRNEDGTTGRWLLGGTIPPPPVAVAAGDR